MTTSDGQAQLIDSMGKQLSELYAEQATLAKAFGPLSADQTVTMVRSLEQQVVSLYQEAGSAGSKRKALR